MPLKFKQFIAEAKLKWEKEWDGTLDTKGRKVYIWKTTDGKWELELTGYYQKYGRTPPSNKGNSTSWAILDKSTGEYASNVYTSLAKAKAAVQNELSESLDEAKTKPGTPIVITKGQYKGKTGRVGEIHHGPSRSSEKTYVIDMDDNPTAPNIRLTKSQFKINKVSESLDEANAKTLSIAQRRKAGRLLKRRKMRMKVARKRALRKAPNQDVLARRSRRAVRQTLFKKFARGKGKKDISMSRRGSIERRINRLSPQRIKAMSLRQKRVSRKVDRQRRMGSVRK